MIKVRLRRGAERAWLHIVVTGTSMLVKVCGKGC